MSKKIKNYIYFVSYCSPKNGFSNTVISSIGQIRDQGDVEYLEDKIWDLDVSRNKSARSDLSSKPCIISISLLCEDEIVRKG